MPQEIRVLQCFSCNIFQVDIVKKAKRWQCKLCGEKQSVFKEYYRGSGSDCRFRAQQLNLEQGQRVQQESNDYLSMLEDEQFDMETMLQLEQQENIAKVNNASAHPNGKWKAFLD